MMVNIDDKILFIFQSEISPYFRVSPQKRIWIFLFFRVGRNIFMKIDLLFILAMLLQLPTCVKVEELGKSSRCAILKLIWKIEPVFEPVKKYSRRIDTDPEIVAGFHEIEGLSSLSDNN